MRILFDSKKTIYKNPYGCLTPGQECRLHIHIPVSVGTSQAVCVICAENGQFLHEVPLSFHDRRGLYDIWGGMFCMDKPGLFFYYFRITGTTGTFRLFKQGDQTNMEAGDCWQLSCIPPDFTVPDWAKGAVIYQVFPDRFHKAGECDLSRKLKPYIVHQQWDEDIFWQPSPEGEVLNNDFYGGNFQGITEKMDYIASLGTTILYLNPISKSFSSHRYDTGDYMTPDPMLGTQEDFVHLCDAAHARGIRVILDGVYSHTGANSLYFDKEKVFGENGAYCKKESPYYSWYTFYSHPDSYHCWWDFDTLPTVNKLDPAFIDYIITGENSVIAHWLRLGADGFRLDVADELPNEFLAIFRRKVRQLKPDALVIGEVWEDASNKISYDVRRRYFTDGTLDSVMNYPFRTAIINFIKSHDDGSVLQDTVMTITENYPDQVVCCNMNLLGTHDTPRILTALVDDYDGTREALAHRKLSLEQYTCAQQRLILASFLQYCLPGSPSIYYADEAGMQGHKDPFNRRTFPWGKEDPILLAHFKLLGQLKKNNPALRLGDISFFRASDGRVGFTRTCKTQKIRAYINTSDTDWDVPGQKILSGYNYQALSPDWIRIGPMGACITEEV